MGWRKSNRVKFGACRRTRLGERKVFIRDSSGTRRAESVVKKNLFPSRAVRSWVDVVQLYRAVEAEGTDRWRKASFRRGNGVGQVSRMTGDQMPQIGLSSCPQLKFGNLAPGPELLARLEAGKGWARPNPASLRCFVLLTTRRLTVNRGQQPMDQDQQAKGPWEKP